MNSKRPAWHNEPLGQNFNTAYSAATIQQRKDVAAILKRKVPSLTYGDSTYLQFLSKYQKSTKSEFSTSLTMWNGGTINAPVEVMFESLKYRASDIDRGLVLTDNELVSSPDLFHFFVDVDIKTSGRLPDVKQLLDMARISQQAVTECFEKIDAKMTVLLSIPKPVWNADLDKRKMKLGMHLVFPNVTVRSNHARHLCAAVREAVGKHAPKFIDTIDDDPYGSGNVTRLRPPYAHKIDTCINCHNIDATDCEVCSGMGRCVIPSTYIPTYLISHNGEDMSLKNMSTLNRLYVATIRAAPGEKLSSGYKEHVEENEKYNDTQKQLNKRKRFTAVTSVDNVPMFDEVGKLLLFNGFKDLAIRKISQGQNCYFIDVVGEQSKMCPIKGAGQIMAHQKNSIFFMLMTGGKKLLLLLGCYDAECKKNRSKMKKKLQYCIPYENEVSIRQILGLAAPIRKNGEYRRSKDYVKAHQPKKQKLSDAYKALADMKKSFQ